MTRKFEGQPAAVYLRVSTGYQQGSMDLQDSACLEYAKSKGLIVVPEFLFKDEATSGSVPIDKREGGRALLKLLGGGMVKHLITLKIDRLGRNAINVQQTWDLLTVNLGVTVHIVDLGGDSICSASPTGKFMVAIMSAFAELERNTINDRISAMMDSKIANGEQCGSIPYGWMAVPSGRFAARSRKPIMLLKPHPEEQPRLLQMFAWREQGMSYHQIAKELNQLNVPTKHRDKIQRVGGKERVVKCKWSSGLVYNIMGSKRAMILWEQVKK